MTLPIELLRRRGGAVRYDALVVGAGMSGLVCATILARGGMRVAVIEAAKRAGGRMQTVSHQGYAIDLGPLVWDAYEVKTALAAAAVGDVALVELAAPAALRVLTVDGAKLLGEPRPLPLP